MFSHSKPILTDVYRSTRPYIFVPDHSPNSDTALFRVITTEAARFLLNNHFHCKSWHGCQPYTAYSFYISVSANRQRNEWLYSCFQS